MSESSESKSNGIKSPFGPTAPGDSMLMSIVKGVFEPGANAATILVMNIILISVIVFIAAAIALGFRNIHAYIMLFLSCGLFICVQALLFLLKDMNDNGEASEPADTKKTN